MPLEPDLDEQQLLADSFERYGEPMGSRELAVALAIGLFFAVGCAALWLGSPPGSFSVAGALLCLLTLTLSTEVRFDTPFGFTVPTQLAFVPMLFVLPASLVPLGVVLALALAALRELLRGELPADRLLQIPGNACFALGPAAVFVIGGTEAWSAGPVLLIAALAAQFLVDFTVSTVRYAVGLGARFASQIRELWVYVVDAGLAAPGLVIAHATRHTPVAVLSLLPLLGLLFLLANERQRRMRSLVELNYAYRGTALVLGDVVEADDGYTGEHCRSVVALALDVASGMGLGSAELRNLEFGALLHDVGKIAIPKEIINKPGKLDAEEWALVKTHTIVGQQMLDRVGGFMREVGQVVRSHHERWDGKGYPDGLRAQEIPIEARIITCCDSWNAMRTDRVYRAALSHEQAIAEIHANTGSQFDPDVAAALIDVVSPPADRPAPPAAPPASVSGGLATLEPA